MAESRLTTVGGLLFVFLWSTGYISASFALESKAPFTVALMRFTGTFVLIGALVWFRRAGKPVEWTAWLHSMLAGCLLQAGFFGFTYPGMHIGVPPAAVGLIAGLMPLITTLGGVILLGEQVSRNTVFGLALGFAGVALVVGPDLTSPDSVQGYLLVFLALMSLSAGTLYQKRWCSGLDPAVSLLAQVLAASLLVAPLAWFLERFQFEPGLASIGGMAWIVIVNSCLGILLFLWLLGRGAAGQVSSLFFLVPPVTAVLAASLLDSQFTGPDLTGFALASVGVWWGQRRVKSDQRRVESDP